MASLHVFDIAIYIRPVQIHLPSGPVCINSCRIFRCPGHVILKRDARSILVSLQQSAVTGDLGANVSPDYIVLFPFEMSCLPFSCT